MKKHLIRNILWVFALVPGLLTAQELSNMRTVSIDIQSDTILLDSLSVVPGTFRLITESGNPLPDSSFSLIPEESLLIIIDSASSATQLIATFRVFPVKFSTVVQKKQIENVQGLGQGFQSQYIYKKDDATSINDIFQQDGLSKSGSIARGISFGNNQDVVVNSNFNLQLSGKLSPEIEVMAAITDNNVPVQPYGNSQIIQEFDKVFIQLKHKNVSLIAGDFDLKRPKGYFMSFFKKLQGGMLTGNFKLNKKSQADPINYNVRAAIALSRGKFAQNKIQGIEGNQGPYKLRGSDGENFIIILAGSEKVYIDGRLLMRGENFDYVIDYNTAEITFTPNVMINKDKRITVEFEYSDKRYARSLTFASNEVTFRKSSVYLNYYSESDLKNQSLQQELSDEDKAFLSTIGDDIQYAYLPGYDSLGYSEDEVRYKMVDTIVEDIPYDSIFVFSTHPDSAVYRVSYASVGPGNGNYIQVISGINGRTFQWVAPVDGIPQGDHEPVRFLVTPKRTRMFVAGGEHLIGKSTRIKGEVALSGKDLNTFSDLDSEDNFGTALKMNIEHDFTLGGESSGWQLRTTGAYEFIQKDFSPIERFRPVEFERDWNLPAGVFDGNENFGSVLLDLQKQGLGNFLYELNTFTISGNYQGIKNRLATKTEFHNFEIYFDASLLNTQQDSVNTNFIRQRAGISKKIKGIQVGLRQEMENNRIYLSDSLQSTGFSFLQWEAFFKTSDTSKMPVSLTYKNRTDRLPVNNQLSKAFTGHDMEMILRPLNKASHRLSLTSTLRSLVVAPGVNTGKEPENNLVGRLDYYLRLFKGAITFNTYYEIGSGLNRKQEFYYLKVPDGEGIFTWIDYNNDGVQQLNEFEIAPFKDQANYIRVFVQSEELVKNFFNKFNASVNLNPAAVWKTKDGIRKFIARLSDQFVFRTENKSGTDNPWMAFNPFQGIDAIEDTALIFQSSSFRNTLYYDRINPKFSVDFNFLRNSNKTLMIQGFETRRLFRNEINLRWNFYKTLTVKLFGASGTSKRGSEYFAENNFSININELQPRLIWQPGATVRLELFYKFGQKLNTLGEVGEESVNHTGGMEFNYRILNKGNILAKGNYLYIKYNGELNTPIAFEMLEGFLPGNNATWSISYQQNLSKFLQLNLIYDGRKSETANTVHVGSVQVRAHF